MGTRLAKIVWTASFCLAIVGCNGESNVEPAAPTITEADLVGKWRLVKMGDQTPSQLGFKSVEVDISREGTWSAVGEKPSAPKGYVMARRGKWLLVNGSLHYDFDNRTGDVRPQLEAGRLRLDPDFLLIDYAAKNRAAEYERIE